MDRQIKAELAWAIPYKLKERIGSYEFNALFSLSEKQINEYMNAPTHLHRYTDKMAPCIYSAIQIIGDKYDGDASLIWSGVPSSAEVIYKARALHPEFPGVLDFPCWEIGRSWCRPQKTTCEECYMGEICPSKS